MNINGKIKIFAAMLAAAFMPVAAQSLLTDPVVFNTDSISEVVEAVEAVDSAAVEPASTAAEFFVSAPVRIFPTIDHMTRLDMLDYFRAGSDKASANLVGGEARVLVDEPERLVVKTSGVSEYELTILPAPSYEGGKILMLTRTLSVPAKDSTVKFYTVGWNEIDGLFKVPVLDDWMLPEASKNRADVENAVPFVLARLEYSPGDRTVTLTNNLSDYIPEEQLGIAQGSIRKSIVYRWNGKKFVKVK